MSRLFVRASLLALPVTLAALSSMSASALAGCHLVDCVENVYVKPNEVKKKTCEDLWILRNSIFKDAHYCFKSPRAIAFFGNQGCQYDDEASVPLNDYQRHNIGVIESTETDNGC